VGVSAHLRLNFMDNISDARLAGVHPRLASRVRSMAEQLATENITIKVVQGFRTWPEQAVLYNRGRDANGNVVDKSKVVTNAKAGTSWHNFGLAVDVAPFDGGVPDWNASHPAWKRIVAVGESVGLISGSTWRTFPDWPHFQMTGRYPESPDDAVRFVFETGGIDAVWNDSGLDETSISA
jgi:peptidoglycan L-alanyl-D-glutamate endopeptidase CwlK